MYDLLQLSTVAFYLTLASQPVLNSGIIYCRTVKHCENLVSVLREAGIKAEAYNGAKQDKDRNSVYKDWIENRIQIVVATVSELSVRMAALLT